jgi:hypothetical protein
LALTLPGPTIFLWFTYEDMGFFFYHSLLP